MKEASPVAATGCAVAICEIGWEVAAFQQNFIQCCHFDRACNQWPLATCEAFGRRKLGACLSFGKPAAMANRRAELNCVKS